MNKMSGWQGQEEHLAPISTVQSDLIYDISKKNINEGLAYKYDTLSHENINDKVMNSEMNLETSHQFFEWFAKIEEKLERDNNIKISNFYSRLCDQKENVTCLLENADCALDDMNKLTESYHDILSKTNALNEISEQLLVDQTKLLQLSEEVNKKLKYFTSVTQLSQSLCMPTLSVSSANFIEILEKTDSCIKYMSKHSNYKESYFHLLKYKQSLYTILFLIKNYVQQVFVTATEQALFPKLVEGVSNSGMLPVNSDVTFSLYYGKFQSSAAKVKPVIQEVEKRSEESTEFAQLLVECQQSYLNQRDQLMNSAIANSIKQLAESYKGDNSCLFRSACTFMLHVCQDEIQLFHHFFNIPSHQLTMYLEKLCTHLYDTLRPLIVHINHTETLTELCSILRVEMSVENDNDVIMKDSYMRVLWQLLQDVQERLVFRTHIYLQTDLLQYKPSAGDLAYPEKLQMMESIALSQAEEDNKSRTGNSPADLHGMWYPTVKRTLVCLSRLYRCVDRPIFQGLSQEALAICVQTIVSASQTISTQKTLVDGQLFQIKHLLILREQIAPFQVDFTVKEMSLDFSKMKTAAFGLLQKRSQLFALNANNALLEFLLEGTPQVKEQLVDSRKEVDRQLKHTCEKFIEDCTKLLVGNIHNFLEKIQALPKKIELKGQLFSKPEKIATFVVDDQRNIKSKLVEIQRSMQLYLSNRETEFILLKPIKNNVISNFVQLEQILVQNKYGPEEMLIIACPTAEQISILMSSASLLAEQETSTEI